jgi:hypothetical protein
MKITVSQVAPHPQGLVCGLRIEHERAGWVRFATTVLVTAQLDEESRATLTAALNRADDTDSRYEDVALF